MEANLRFTAADGRELDIDSYGTASVNRSSLNYKEPVHPYYSQ